MRFTELELAGAYAVEIDAQSDERGFFARTYCARELQEAGLETRVAQSSVSFNLRRGTVRGMHYQVSPHEETKTVRCTAGSIFDVIVDMRAGSPTYAKWIGMELTATNHLMLYVPAGFAHGFQTLADHTEVLYQISVEYSPSAGRGVCWNDPSIGIRWPMIDGVTISARDASYPGLGKVR